MLTIGIDCLKMKTFKTMLRKAKYQAGPLINGIGHELHMYDVSLTLMQ